MDDHGTTVGTLLPGGSAPGHREAMPPSPFHLGERMAQARAGLRSLPSGAAIRDAMPDQHRVFFARLPFLPVATRAGAEGMPVATILTGAPGFVTSPDPRTLHIAARPDPADPASHWLVPGAPVGILGIDLATRRRNRANGRIRDMDATGLTVAIEQSFGNCPQYIQARDLLPPGAAQATSGKTELLHGLDAARAAVARADTFFVASGVGGSMDLSHRGGRPGFVRVRGEVLEIPDFRGNGYFNTLGNLLLDPRAALLFPDFATGDLLHLAGRAEVDWDAADAVRGAERVWRLHVEQGWRRPTALPWRWAFRDWAPTTMQTGIWDEDEGGDARRHG